MFEIRFVLIALLSSLSFNATAATGCDEWATMVQVLVLRWQMDDQFHGKTNVDLRNEMQRMMGDHPDIETALKYVDYAYIHRNDNYQDVWKTTYDQCSATAL
jgi:hypothetical protein